MDNSAVELVHCLSPENMHTLLLFVDPFQDHLPEYRTALIGGKCGGWWDLVSINRNLRQYTRA